MASPVLLDFDALTRPVSESAPAGPNLREDTSPTALYFQIKEARATARAAERAGQVAPGEPDAEWKPLAPEAIALAWQPLMKLAPQALERSKDLEIAASWIEALARIEGFAGLRDGFRLARELIERFWEGLYPLPDEEGMASRVAPLAGLNGIEADGTLIAPIALVPLTEAASEGGPYATWHYRQAQDLERVANPEVRAARQNAGTPTVAQIQAAVLASRPAFLAERLADIDACLAEYDALTRALDERCGGGAPPSSNVRNALSAARDALAFIAKDRLPVADDGGSAASPMHDGDRDGAEPREHGGVPGTIRTRDEALRALSLAANYFRRTEPHSPLSYAVEQTVRWASLPLPELLRELIKDDTARQQFCLLTGIREEAP